MSKVTDERIVAIKALFGTGHKLQEGNFADLIDAIQEAAQEHQHVSGGGAGSGTGNAGPITIWKTIVFCVPGILAAGTNVAPSILVDEAMTIDHVYGYVRTAGSVSATVIDVNKNGTSIFTNQGNRVWLISGDHEDQTDTPGVTSLAKNDRLDIDLDLVDSGGVAADLTIMVRCKQEIAS